MENTNGLSKDLFQNLSINANVPKEEEEKANSE